MFGGPSVYAHPTKQIINPKTSELIAMNRLARFPRRAPCTTREIQVGDVEFVRAIFIIRNQSASRNGLLDLETPDTADAWRLPIEGGLLTR
jgi:hypothetical protein